MSRQTAKRGLSFGRASDSPRMRSVTTDTQELGARRVVHEMRASVFVARTVLLVMCWCASLSPLVLRLLWHLFMFWDGNARSQQGGRMLSADYVSSATLQSPLLP